MDDKAARLQPPIPANSSYAPRTIRDERGELLGVLVSRDDYWLFLRVLASNVDWDALPSHLQDAVDNMLADEALEEGGKPVALRDLLARVPT